MMSVSSSNGERGTGILNLGNTMSKHTEGENAQPFSGKQVSVTSTSGYETMPKGVSVGVMLGARL